MERENITINVVPAVAVLYAKFIELNLDGLVEFGRENLHITDITAQEFANITKELFNKSLEKI